MGLQVITNQ